MTTATTASSAQCRNGHASSNFYVGSDGWRKCRACRAATYARRKAGERPAKQGKLTFCRRLDERQRALIDADPELVHILIGWARRRGGADYPAEELAHDCLMVAASNWDPAKGKTFRGWATAQVRWAFSRYARRLGTERKRRARLWAAIFTVVPRGRMNAETGAGRATRGDRR